jgi:hypothetical protein
VAGKELGVAEQRVDGGLSTRGACSLIAGKIMKDKTYGIFNSAMDQH